jgi:hypothetical protein
MFTMVYAFPSLPHPRSERRQQQHAQKMRRAKRSIIRHMPIYLTGGEDHYLINQYVPQIFRTVFFPTMKQLFIF